MPSKSKLGKFGEDMAVKFIQKQGYRIVERNYRNYIGEIDIIAIDQGTYSFIEVKMRERSQFGSPLEAVNIRKQMKISKIAQCYLQEKNIEDKNCRFDVVSIILEKDISNRIEIIKDAFDLI